MSIDHSLEETGEAASLNYTAPAGISVLFTPKSPIMIPASGELNVTMVVSATAATTVGNDTVQITGVSGAESQSASFTLMVVQYRVVMSNNEFLPPVLNVTAGSTVYWQNLDGPAGGCAAPGASGGSGIHSVVFTTLPVNSSTITQFNVFSYTFTTPGSYFYYSSDNPDQSMNGTINVVAANGGVGMAPRMPVFSYFKGGSLAVPAKAEAKSAPFAPQSLATAGGVALAGLFVPSVIPALLAGARVAATVSLFGLVLLSFALAMLALTRRVGAVDRIQR